MSKPGFHCVIFIHLVCGIEFKGGNSQNEVVVSQTIFNSNMQGANQASIGKLILNLGLFINNKLFVKKTEDELLSCRGQLAVR